MEFLQFEKLKQKHSIDLLRLRTLLIELKFEELKSFSLKILNENLKILQSTKITVQEHEKKVQSIANQNSFQKLRNEENKIVDKTEKSINAILSYSLKGIFIANMNLPTKKIDVNQKLILKELKNIQNELNSQLSEIKELINQDKTLAIEKSSMSFINNFIEKFEHRTDLIKATNFNIKHNILNNRNSEAEKLAKNLTTFCFELYQSISFCSSFSLVYQNAHRYKNQLIIDRYNAIFNKSNLRISKRLKPNRKNIEIKNILTQEEHEKIEIFGLVEDLKIYKSNSRFIKFYSSGILKDPSSGNSIVFSAPYVNLSKLGMKNGCFCRMSGSVKQGIRIKGKVQPTFVIEKVKVKSDLIRNSYKALLLNYSENYTNSWYKNLNIYFNYLPSKQA